MKPCSTILLITAVWVSAACNSFDKELPPRSFDECTRHSDCSEAFVNGETGETEPAVCVQGPAPDDAASDALVRRCVQVTTPECPDLVAPDGDRRVPDDAILLGALMPFAGPQMVNTPPRLRSAVLAMEQINAAGVGGIPGPSGTGNRRLAMVACDEATDLTRAAQHLVGDLRVPAVVGPIIGQSLFELQPIIRDHDTAFFSPTYDRDAVEVAVRVTSPDEAIQEEARLIERLRPRDNVIGHADTDVPF
jgi:hypothetical protein